MTYEQSDDQKQAHQLMSDGRFWVFGGAEPLAGKPIDQAALQMIANDEEEALAQGADPTLAWCYVYDLAHRRLLVRPDNDDVPSGRVISEIQETIEAFQAVALGKAAENNGDRDLAEILHLKGEGKPGILESQAVIVITLLPDGQADVSVHGEGNARELADSIVDAVGEAMKGAE